MLNTVKKIGPVLELFTPERPEWRMTEIARALDMPKSSAHSLLTTLAEVGLLSPGSNGGYRLGWNLLSLAERMRASLDFCKYAAPHMHKLAAALKETVLLAVLDRHQVVYVERAEGTHPMVRLAGVRVGSRAPAHCTACGKVLMAYREPVEVQAVLESAGLRAMTQRTITDLDKLQEELVKVRSRGLAYDLGEIVPEVSCVAAPVVDRYNSVIAAMSVSVPAYRFERSRETVADRLRATAAAVSAELASIEPEPHSAADDIEVLLARGPVPQAAGAASRSSGAATPS